MPRSPHGFCATDDGETLASAYANGEITIWQRARPHGPIRTLGGTVYDMGVNCTIFLPGTQALVVASFRGGVECWDWTDGTLCWRREDIVEVQGVMVHRNTGHLLVECDPGQLWRLDAASGVTIGVITCVRDAIISPQKPLVLSLWRKRLVLQELMHGHIIWSVPTPSWGLLCGCFTHNAIVISDPEGVLRTMSLDDGRELGSLTHASWNGFVAMAQIASSDRVGIWAAVRGDTNGGELLVVDTQLHDPVVRHRKSWIHAYPVKNGTSWVFEDGSLVDIGKE